MEEEEYKADRVEQLALKRAALEQQARQTLSAAEQMNLVSKFFDEEPNSPFRRAVAAQHPEFMSQLGAPQDTEAALDAANKTGELVKRTIDIKRESRTFEQQVRKMFAEANKAVEDARGTQLDTAWKDRTYEWRAQQEEGQKEKLWQEIQLNAAQNPMKLQQLAMDSVAKLQDIKIKDIDQQRHAAADARQLMDSYVQALSYTTLPETARPYLEAGLQSLVTALGEGVQKQIKTSGGSVKTVTDVTGDKTLPGALTGETIRRTLQGGVEQTGPRSFSLGAELQTLNSVANRTPVGVITPPPGSVFSAGTPGVDFAYSHQTGGQRFQETARMPNVSGILTGAWVPGVGNLRTDLPPDMMPYKIMDQQGRWANAGIDPGRNTVEPPRGRGIPGVPPPPPVTPSLVGPQGEPVPWQMPSMLMPQAQPQQKTPAGLKAMAPQMAPQGAPLSAVQQSLKAGRWVGAQPPTTAEQLQLAGPIVGKAFGKAVMDGVSSILSRISSALDGAAKKAWESEKKQLLTPFVRPEARGLKKGEPLTDPNLVSFFARRAVTAEHFNDVVRAAGWSEYKPGGAPQPIKSAAQIKQAWADGHGELLSEEQQEQMKEADSQRRLNRAFQSGQGKYGFDLFKTTPKERPGLKVAGR